MFGPVAADKAMSTSLLNELDGGVCNGLSYAEHLGQD